MKVPFTTCFEIVGDKLFILPNVRINGVTIMERLEINGYLGGVDWKLFVGRDLDVKTNKGIKVIVGIF